MRKNVLSPRRKNFARLGAAALVASSLTAVSSATAADASTGLLLLYSEVGKAKISTTLTLLQDQDCSLWRQGSVAAARGNLDVGDPDGFVLLACGSDVLAGSPGLELLDDLQKLDSDLRAVEGPLLFRLEDEAGSGAVSERDYVLKISHYNNQSPAAREADLHRINALAGEKTDAWTNEAMISGLRAVGMPTPDEVVVIRYDDPQQGERFRGNNQDLLKEIGAFNKKHLTEYSYISARPAR